jgi:hypothetical protein
MRKLRLLSVLSLCSLTISTLFIPSASAIVAGNCNVDVASATGVVLVNNGGLCYLAFSATGANSFTVPSGVTTANVLVIAGGGAGGSGAWGGGGGAGAVVYGASYPLTPGATMNLSVGAGGLAGTASLDPATNRSNNGIDSWINSSSSFVAKGGGAGASFAWGDNSAVNRNGSNGGSGGGGTENAAGGAGGTSTQTLPANATVTYANAGGSTPATNNVSGGGGGGAGAVGANNTSSGVGGAGGAGINVYSSWFTALGQFGVGGFIAGGGGGGTNNSRGAGGSGGGGTGADTTSTTAGNGAANTGSGGGGATYNGSPLPGGNGGSGLIIFRFTAVVNPAVINTPTLATTVSKGVNTTITVTMDSPGRVQFFVGNKRIGKCLSVATTGSSPNFTATCSWRPVATGTQSIRAQLTPTNGAQAIQMSPARSVLVLRRTTTR